MSCFRHTHNLVVFFTVSSIYEPLKRLRTVQNPSAPSHAPGCVTALVRRLVLFFSALRIMLTHRCEGQGYVACHKVLWVEIGGAVYLNTE